MFSTASIFSKWTSQSNFTRIATSAAFSIAVALIIGVLLRAVVGPFEHQLGGWAAAEGPVGQLACFTLVFLLLMQSVNAVLVEVVRQRRLRQIDPLFLRLVHSLGSDLVFVALTILFANVLKNDVRFAAVIMSDNGIAVGLAGLAVIVLSMVGIKLFIKGDPNDLNNPVLKFAILKLLPAVALVVLEFSPETIAAFAGMLMLDRLLSPVGANLSMRSN